MDLIALDKKKDLMAAIFRKWEHTLNETERQILIKKFVAPTFVQKAFCSVTYILSLTDDS
jgi:hypothetical protein